jgi:DNA-binding MarR family transcriptional regulator
MSNTIAERQHAVKTGSDSTTRTPAGEAFNAVLFQVIQLTRLFTAAGETLARPAGQTLARWLVLAEVKDEPATVAEIARRLRLARQSVQRVADVLVEDGLAGYEPNPRHRRSKLLRLTRKGKGALRKIETAQGAWTDELGARIGERPLRQGSALLDDIIRAVDETEPSP